MISPLLYKAVVIAVAAETRPWYVQATTPACI